MTTPGNDVVSARRITHALAQSPQQQLAYDSLHGHRTAAVHTTAGTTTDRCRHRRHRRPTLLLMNAASAAKSDLVPLSSRSARARRRIESILKPSYQHQCTTDFVSYAQNAHVIRYNTIRLAMSTCALKLTGNQ